MGAVKLTKRYVDAATYRGNAERNTEDVRWDTEIRGFGLRIYPSGKKTFIIRYRKDGRRKAFTLGPYGALPVEKARRMAQLQLAGVIDGKADPSAEKRSALPETQWVVGGSPCCMSEAGMAP